MRIMGDSTTASDIPANVDMVAGYVDGKWPTFSELAKLFPNKPRVSITTYLSDAQVIDVENGNATPAQSVDWVKGQRAKGKIPTLYCNLATWPQVVSVFHTAGEALPVWWVAKYDNVAQLDVPGATVKQYGGNQAGHYDLSVVADYWPGVDPERTQPMTLDAEDIAAIVKGILGAPLNDGVATVQHALEDTRVIARRTEVEIVPQLATLVSDVAAIKAKIGA